MTAHQSLVEYFAHKHDSGIKRIVMVVFSDEDKALYELAFSDTFRKQKFVWKGSDIEIIK